MKKTFLTALMTSMLIGAYAQDYTMNVGSVVTEISFYSPEIVRVTKYQKADALGKTDPKVVLSAAKLILWASGLSEPPGDEEQGFELRFTPEDAYGD